MLARKNWHRCAALILFICALVIAGCGKNSDAPKPIDDPHPAPPGPTTPNLTTPEDPAPESLAKTKLDVVLTPQACLEESKKDWAFLSTKYANKVIEVSGIVDDCRVERSGDGYLALRCGQSKLSDHIRYEIHEKNLTKKVIPSQTVVLRIRGPKVADDLGRAKWEIIEAKGDIPTVPVEEFARELATTNAAALRKKYSEQHVFVTGAVVNVESSNGGTRLFLGDSEKQVECWFPGEPFARIPFSQSQKESLKPGLTVKVCGEYAGGLGGLGQCILLEPAP